MSVFSPAGTQAVSSTDPQTQPSGGELKPYMTPSLVTYGNLGKITQLDGNQEFDGLAGTEGATGPPRD